MKRKKIPMFHNAKNHCNYYKLLLKMKAFNQKSVGIRTTYNFEPSFFLLYKFFTQTMSQWN